MEEEQDNLSSSSSSDEESETKFHRRQQTHVTVCDINQAMLDVGKKKADDMGITSGKGLKQTNFFLKINNKGIILLDKKDELDIKLFYMIVRVQKAELDLSVSGNFSRHQ